MTTRLIAALAGGLISAAAAAQNAEHPELLADAAERTSRLAASGGGYDKGFFLSDGGANKLVIGGTAQFRYNMNFRDDESAGDQDDFTHGFQARRTRLRFGGSIWDKNLTYEIQGEFSRSNGAFTLLDAKGQYKFGSGMFLRWGQYKTGLLREELVSHRFQLTADRSTTNQVFTAGRSQGIGIGQEHEKWRYTVDFSDGLNTLNTDFNSGTEADYALTARAEWMWAGKNWDWTKDFTSFRGSEFAGMVGAAAHYQDGGETGFTTDIAIAEVTLDVSVEGDGWNAFAAGIWRNTEPAAGDSTDDFGAVLQGGIFVSEQAELFMRYAAVFPDDANGDEFHTVTAGVNYFISPKSHAVKFTGDATYYFDDQAGSIVGQNTASNLLTDSEDGQIGIRLQMQVLF